MVTHGYKLNDDITLITVVDNNKGSKLKAYFYYKDNLASLYDEIILGKVKLEQRSIKLFTQKSIKKLEEKILKDHGKLTIGEVTKVKLYSWIKDTLTQELEKEKEYMMKIKKKRKEKDVDDNSI